MGLDYNRNDNTFWILAEVALYVESSWAEQLLIKLYDLWIYIFLNTSRLLQSNIIKLTLVMHILGL